MADLSVSLAGLKLKNPVIISSSPLTSKIDRLKKAEECGAAGVSIKHTLLSQELKGRSRWYVDRHLGIIVSGDRRLEMEECLELVRKAKEETGLLVMVNMSGLSDPLTWGSMARAMEQAGADAVELNFNCPNLPPPGGTTVALGASLGASPESVRVVAQSVKDAVHIPVIAKLSTESGAIMQVAAACVQAGADVLNVHAGFRAAPGLDIYNGGAFLYPGSKAGNFGGLSGPFSRLVSNRFVADVARAFPNPVIGGGGIFRWEHIVECMMYGAVAVQVCTSVMFSGFEIISSFLQGLRQFMETAGYSEMGEITGLALKNITAPGSMPYTDVVANIILDRCSGCRNCEKLPTCEAIEYNPSQKKCLVNFSACLGCGLCVGICARKAIEMVTA